MPVIVSKEEAFNLIQDQPTHFNYIDKTGSRFGMLQVLHYAGRNNKGKHHFACECDCGNYCLITSVNINENTVGCGCLKATRFIEAAADARRISVPETEKWILENTPYLPICKNEPSTRSRWNFYCKEHGVFSAILNLIKQERVGCPGCRPGGGYKSSAQGLLYVHRIIKDGECLGLKFGITNNSVERRKYQIEFSSNGSVVLETIFTYKHKDGSVIRDLETRIKKQFQTKVISKDILPVGYTETVSLEDEANLIQWLTAATI